MTDLDPIGGYDFDLYVRGEPSICIGRFQSLAINTIKDSDQNSFSLERGLVDLRVMEKLGPLTNKILPLVLKDLQTKKQYVVKVDDVTKGAIAGRCQVVNRMEGVIENYP